MIRRFITLAQAEAMRARAIGMLPAIVVGDQWRGLVGTRAVEYDIVPDGDPRLTGPAHADPDGA